MPGPADADAKAGGEFTDIEERRCNVHADGSKVAMQQHWKWQEMLVGWGSWQTAQYFGRKPHYHPKKAFLKSFAAVEASSMTKN